MCIRDSVSIEHLANGQIVRLGDLGSVRVSFSSEGADKESDITANSITDARIIFTPSPRLKEMLKTLKFEKAKQ